MVPILFRSGSVIEYLPERSHFTIKNITITYINIFSSTLVLFKKLLNIACPLSLSGPCRHGIYIPVVSLFDIFIT